MIGIKSQPSKERMLRLVTDRSENEMMVEELWNVQSRWILRRPEEEREEAAVAINFTGEVRQNWLIAISQPTNWERIKFFVIEDMRGLLMFWLRIRFEGHSKVKNRMCICHPDQLTSTEHVLSCEELSHVYEAAEHVYGFHKRCRIKEILRWEAVPEFDRIKEGTLQRLAIVERYITYHLALTLDPSNKGKLPDYRKRLTPAQAELEKTIDFSNVILDEGRLHFQF